MPNTILLSVENPDVLRGDGQYGTGALIRVQSSATEAGAYADLSGTGSDPTVAILAGERSYEADDPNGTGSTWYRTRYENAGATRVSDWSDPFQVGDETGGLLASLYDVKQEIGIPADNNDDDESLLEKLRQVTTSIETYTNRWFVPRPLSGTTTYRFHSSYGRRLHIPKGIRSITSLGTASISQPASGGTYALAGATDYYIDPPEIDRSPGWPGLFVRVPRTAGALFYDAAYGVEITGAFGWASVPADIQGVAIRSVIRRHIGKGGGGTAVAIGPAGTEFLLPDMSGSDRGILEMYRQIPV
jgi:hypothetical protein